MNPISFPAHLAHVPHGAKLSRHFVMIAVLSLSSFVGAQAHPLDSPETIYIDGVPCNGACQSYIAWSRKTRERNSGAPRASTLSADHKISPTITSSVAAPKLLTPLPPTREVVPVPRKAPRDQTAGLEYLIPIPEDHSVPAKTAAPGTKTAPPETQTAALITRPAAPEIKAAVPANLSDKTIEEQILAATARAEQVTATSIPAVDEKKEVAKNSDQTESVAAKDDTTPRSPNLVVLILARADIKSIADLANKDIAIEGKQAQFREQIRTDIIAAGAPMVELRDGNASAIDRLVSGEQPAAVLTLASPEAADRFPEIQGFRTFRIPLSPS
jgi:hypothetical protein